MKKPTGLIRSCSELAQTMRIETANAPRKVFISNIKIKPNAGFKLNTFKSYLFKFLLNAGDFKTFVFHLKTVYFPSETSDVKCFGQIGLVLFGYCFSIFNITRIGIQA